MGKEKLQLNYTIRKMNTSDLEDVAQIHKKSWREDHFSSRLNIPLLKVYYSYLLSYNEYCYISDSNQKVIGFVVAGSKTRVAVKKFISKYYLKMLWVILLNPKFIISRIKIFLRIFSPKSKSNSRAVIRLLSIAVDPEFEGYGVGAALMATVEREVQNDNHQYLGLSVNKGNQKAINLYNKMGWDVESISGSGIYYIKELNKIK